MSNINKIEGQHQEFSINGKSEENSSDVKITDIKDKSLVIEETNSDLSEKIGPIKNQETHQFSHLEETHGIIVGIFKEGDDEIVRRSSDLSTKQESLSIQIEQLLLVRDVIKVVRDNLSNGDILKKSLEKSSLVPEALKEKMMEIIEVFKDADEEKAKAITTELELLEKIVEKKIRIRRTEKVMIDEYGPRLESKEESSLSSENKIAKDKPDIIQARFSKSWSLKDHSKYLECHVSKYDPNYTRNKSIIRASIQKDPHELKYVPIEHDDYAEFALLAIENNEELLYTINENTLLPIIPESFLNDIDFMRKAISKNILVYLNTKIFLQLPQELKEDKELAEEINKEKLSNKKYVMAMLGKNNTKYSSQGWKFSEVSPKLKNDKEVGFAAVKNNGFNIWYLSKTLKNDIEIVKKVLENTPYNIQYASPEIKNNIDFGKLVVKKGGHLISLLSEDLRKDKNFVKLAIQIDKKSFCHLSEDFSTKDLTYDKEICKFYIEMGGSLEHVGEDIKDDMEIVELALEKNPEDFEFASARIRGMTEIAGPLIQKQPGLFKFAPSRIKRDLALAKIAIRHDITLFDELPNDMKKNKELIELANELKSKETPSETALRLEKSKGIFE